MLSHFSQKNLLSSSFLVLSLFLLSPEGKAMEEKVKLTHVRRYPNNFATMRKTYRNMGVSQQYDFGMPNAPVIHPYNPNNDENKIRTDSGVPTFFYALRSHNINNWPDFQKVLQFLEKEKIDLNNCNVSVIVQNDPWKKTERALKPQSWAIPDAPFLSEMPYNRVAKIRAALISPYESVELLKDGLVKNGEFIDDTIRSHNAISFDKGTQKYVGSTTIVSSGHSLILQGVEDEKNSLFWSIVTDTTNKKTAVTLHAILNDKDIEKLHEKNITTLDPLMKELNKLYSSVIKVERAWKALPIDWDNSPNRERFPKKAIVKEENGKIILTTDCSGAYLYQCESQSLKDVDPGDTLRFSYDIEGEAQGLTLILRDKTHQRPIPGAIFELKNGLNKKQDLRFIIPEGAKDISVLLYNDKTIDSKKLIISSLKLEKMEGIIEKGRKSLPIDWDNSPNRERFPKKAIVKEENGKIILTTDCSGAYLYQRESKSLKDVIPGDTLRFSYDIEGKAQGLTLILRDKTHQRPIPGAFFALQNGVNKKQDLQFIIPEGAKDISVLLYNEAIIPSATLTINELKIEKVGEIIERGRKSLPIDWDNSPNRERFPKKAIVKEENGKIILTTDCSGAYLYQRESKSLKDVIPGDTLRFSFNIEGKAQGLTLILRDKTHQRPIPGAFFALQDGSNIKQDLQFVVPKGAKDISVLLYNEKKIQSTTFTINELKIEKEEDPSILQENGEIYRPKKFFVDYGTEVSENDKRELSLPREECEEYDTIGNGNCFFHAILTEDGQNAENVDEQANEIRNILSAIVMSSDKYKNIMRKELLAEYRIKVSNEGVISDNLNLDQLLHNELVEKIIMPDEVFLERISDEEIEKYLERYTTNSGLESYIKIPVGREVFASIANVIAEYLKIRINCFLKNKECYLVYAGSIGPEDAPKAVSILLDGLHYTTLDHDDETRERKAGIRQAAFNAGENVSKMNDWKFEKKEELNFQIQQNNELDNIGFIDEDTVGNLKAICKDLNDINDIEKDVVLYLKNNFSGVNFSKKDIIWLVEQIRPSSSFEFFFDDKLKEEKKNLEKKPSLILENNSNFPSYKQLNDKKIILHMEDLIQSFKNQNKKNITIKEIEWAKQTGLKNFLEELEKKYGVQWIINQVNEGLNPQSQQSKKVQMETSGGTITLEHIKDLKNICSKMTDRGQVEIAVNNYLDKNVKQGLWKRLTLTGQEQFITRILGLSNFSNDKGKEEKYAPFVQMQQKLSPFQNKISETNILTLKEDFQFNPTNDISEKRRRIKAYLDDEISVDLWGNLGDDGQTWLINKVFENVQSSKPLVQPQYNPPKIELFDKKEEVKKPVSKVKFINDETELKRKKIPAEFKGKDIKLLNYKTIANGDCGLSASGISRINALKIVNKLKPENLPQAIKDKEKIINEAKEKLGIPWESITISTLRILAYCHTPPYNVYVWELFDDHYSLINHDKNWEHTGAPDIHILDEDGHFSILVPEDAPEARAKARKKEDQVPAVNDLYNNLWGRDNEKLKKEEKKFTLFEDD